MALSSAPLRGYAAGGSLRRRRADPGSRAPLLPSAAAVAPRRSLAACRHPWPRRGALAPVLATKNASGGGGGGGNGKVGKNPFDGVEAAVKFLAQLLSAGGAWKINVILRVTDPRVLRSFASRNVASIICPALPHPQHCRPSSARVLSHLASCDVASIVCQAVSAGDMYGTVGGKNASKGASGGGGGGLNDAAESDDSTVGESGGKLELRGRAVQNDSRLTHRFDRVWFQLASETKI